ncbi:TPA: helix-turn-helix domain-containing protein, partial [Bacillus cereus]|nr:helix-turn-helix domain-containing protein [Bacillus cereus]
SVVFNVQICRFFKEDLYNYLLSCSAYIKKITLINLGVWLYYIIYNKKIDLDMIFEKNKLLERNSYELLNPELYISKRLQHSSGHYDISLEKRLFTAIKEGNKEKLIEYVYLFLQEELGVASQEDQLRNTKNNGIIAITLATRYAIEGNLPTKVAFSLNNLYIQTIERLDNIHSVNNLVEEALFTFADYVKVNNVNKYSNIINSCMSYISENIYHDMSLKDIAGIINVNPAYLSRLFKKEVGIPLIEYIQRKRIEEAKKLLTLTTHSLSDIYVLLNFHDQSYFSNVFKRFTNMTPKQYRQKYTLFKGF